MPFSLLSPTHSNSEDGIPPKSLAHDRPTRVRSSHRRPGNPFSVEELVNLQSYPFTGRQFD